MNFYKKFFLGLMYPFSCALWAIFWPFSLLFFVRWPAIFLITEAKMTQKLIPNHHTINSKQLLIMHVRAPDICILPKVDPSLQREMAADSISELVGEE